ncbi:MAG TPA: hypothetical protein RMH99_02265 [Sandaracinaceae bacterium LLY-WYZ-13_1]|nr:hypothetical protein [Sandaracinaceae bacterium LLY-WYZ-13_1]
MPITRARVSDCHRRALSSGWTPNWYLGDCDGDGCPNGADPAPCADGSELCEATPFLGPSCDGTPTPVDAGVTPPVDAGPTPGADAGPTPAPDAGPPLAVDAGPSPPMDAGTAPGVDAAEAPNGLEFTGGGGCTCRAAPARGGSGAWLAALGLLGWIAGRRRR